MGNMIENKMHELIIKLCLDDVKIRKVKDSYTRIKGTPITAAKMKEIENLDGDVRVFAGGKTVITAFENDIPNANITRVPAVLVQSRGVIDVIYYDKPFTFKNEMWAYTSENPVTVKYLYYVLKNNVQHFREAAISMGALPQISLSVTEEFEIPIPPLPVQEEIVRILDKFTELEAELEAELEKELEARKKQYEWYRDRVLSFDENVKRVKIKSIAEVGTGSSNGNEAEVNGKYPFYIRSQTIKQKNKYEFDEEAIIIPGEGGVGDIFHYINGKYALHQRAYRIHFTHPEISARFAFYYMKANFKKFIMGKAVNATVSSIRKPMIEDFEMPMPPIEDQRRIVAILDRFDTLCNDITTGLPAEVAARRKQYEYYRDKLLSFEEVA